jgi:L-threonylcarbamoyladenylate synthase
VGVACPQLPEELTAGTGTIGVRLPDNEEVRALVRACGGALTATSANLSGSPPARTAKETETYFPSGLGLIIDSGEVRATQPSTVLDLSGKPRLIREGAITREDLQRTLGPYGLTPP